MYVTASEHIVNLIHRLKLAVDREQTRRQAGTGPGNRQRAFGRTSMRDYGSEKHLEVPALSGKRKILYGKGLAKQMGSEEYQPWMLRADGMRTDYASLTETLKQLDPETCYQLSQALIRYDKSKNTEEYSDPNFSLQDETQQLAADLMGGITLVECHFTRAMPDGGKSMRAALRLAGLMGFPAVFGEKKEENGKGGEVKKRIKREKNKENKEKAIMVISQKGGGTSRYGELWRR